MFLKSRKFIAAWFDNKCVATSCGQYRRHGGALVGEAPQIEIWNTKSVKFVKMKCQAPLHERKAPHTNVNTPYWRFPGDGSACVPAK